MASRTDDPLRGGSRAESSEDLVVDDPEPRACKHRDWEFRVHGEMEGDSVARLETERLQDKGELIDLPVQLLIGNHLIGLILRLRNPDYRCFAPVLFEVSIDAVVGSVQLASDEPLPERRVARVQRGVERLVPGQDLGVLSIAFGEILLAEPLVNVRVGHIRLFHELGRRVDHRLFFPVNANLRLHLLTCL